MNKRTQQVKTAFNEAKTRGWVSLNGNTLRLTTEHDTPEYARCWWDQDTYREHVFLAFIVVDGEVRGVFHKHAKVPWMDRRDTKISIKRALEILEES